MKSRVLIKGFILESQRKSQRGRSDDDDDDDDDDEDDHDAGDDKDTQHHPSGLV